jgi:hypothetical protein
MARGVRPRLKVAQPGAGAGWRWPRFFGRRSGQPSGRPVLWSARRRGPLRPPLSWQPCCSAKGAAEAAYPCAARPRQRPQAATNRAIRPSLPTRHISAGAAGSATGAACACRTPPQATACWIRSRAHTHERSDGHAPPSRRNRPRAAGTCGKCATKRRVGAGCCVVRAHLGHTAACVQQFHVAAMPQVTRGAWQVKWRGVRSALRHPHELRDSLSASIADISNLQRAGLGKLPARLYLATATGGNCHVMASAPHSVPSAVAQSAIACIHAVCLFPAARKAPAPGAGRA